MEFEVLLQRLRENDPAIKKVNLFSKGVGKDGSMALASSLKDNSNLVVLNLSMNNIGPEGAKHMAKVMATSASLLEVNFYNNGIGDEGTKYLAKALQTSKVERLNIAGDPFDEESVKITSEGLCEIAEVLKENTNLRSLTVADNSIDEKGMQKLIEALSENTTLVHLDVRGNPASDEIITSVEAAMANPPRPHHNFSEIDAIRAVPLKTGVWIVPEQNQKRLPKAPPQWTPDKLSPKCEACGQKFSYTTRKHHCRRCGRCVCANCAPKTQMRPIPEWKFSDPVRHCNDCFASAS